MIRISVGFLEHFYDRFQSNFICEKDVFVSTNTYQKFNPECQNFFNDSKTIPRFKSCNFLKVKLQNISG